MIPMKALSFILTLSALHCNGLLRDHRKEEFQKISNHELLYIDTTNFEPKSVIEFDAFNHHYIIKLTENKHLNPMHLRLENAYPSKDNAKDHFTPRLCHYYGAILNSNETSDFAHAAVSMCNNRGIRARVTAFGETIVIKPSKYYLDPEFDSTQHHHFDDEHLVFKLSDLKHDKIPAPPHTHHMDKLHGLTPGIDRPHRRRLGKINNGKQYVELALLIGPYRVDAYKSMYPSTWFDQIIKDHQDLVNEVSNIYSSTYWGYEVGSIEFVLVEIEFVTSNFGGEYSQLKPPAASTSCLDISSCDIDIDTLTANVKVWASQKRTHFDNLQMIHNMEMGDYSGQAARPGMCKALYSIGQSSITSGITYGVSTVVHEIGHNFNLQHDGQKGEGSGCGENAGLMGYGASKPLDTFSSCSKASMKAFFKSGYANDLSCLGNAVSSNSAMRTLNYPTCVQANGCECLKLSGSDFDKYSMSGQYSEHGMHNGKKYYKLEESASMLFWWTFMVGETLKYEGWTIGSLSDNFGWFRCDKDNVLNCCGEWYIIFGSRIDLESTHVYSCPQVVESGCDDSGDSKCVLIDGLDGDVSSKDRSMDMNGLWRALPGECIGGQHVYELQSPDNADTLYLYHTWEKRFIWWRKNLRWWISKEKGKKSFYAVCYDKGHVRECNEWKVWIWSLGQERTDRTVTIKEGCNQLAFTFDDCMSNNEYNDELCVFSNSTALWHGHAPFELYEKCSNDRAVYFYTHSNVTYYLHYDEYYELLDSNVTTPRWIITKNQLLGDIKASCDSEDLLDCVENSWIRAEGDTDSVTDSALIVEDKYIKVGNSACVVDDIESDDEDNDHGAKKSEQSSVVLLVALVCIMVVIIICLGVVCYRFKSSQTLKQDSGGMMYEQF
eukprot:174713_1